MSKGRVGKGSPATCPPFIYKHYVEGCNRHEAKETLGI